LPPWWLALRGHVAAYESLGVPFALANPASNPTPLTLAGAAAAIPPWDTVLIDPAMRRFLEEANAPTDQFHGVAAAFRELLARRDARLAATLDDPFYGRFEVWRLTRTGDTSTGRSQR